jgi:hypothetical protein
VVEVVDPDVVGVHRHDTGELFTVPAAPEAFDPDPRGHYRLRDNDRIMVNPEFLATWTVQLGEDAAGDFTARTSGFQTEDVRSCVEWGDLRGSVRRASLKRGRSECSVGMSRTRVTLRVS